MNIKKILLIKLLASIVITPIVSMEKENTAQKKFRKEQEKLNRNYTWHKIDLIQFNTKTNHLLKQAINSGIAKPSTVTTINSKFDILAYALRNENKSLAECCFKKGYSPNDVILYDNKKVIPLTVAASCLWPLFKTYNANFNVIIKNERYGTLLHKFTHSEYEKEVPWLLTETTIDINQPNGDGNTIGHELTRIFYHGDRKESEKIFYMLKERGINPFQRNNDNETPQDIAQKIVQWYEKKLSLDPDNIMSLKYQSDALGIVSLWKDYETEYQNNVNRQIQKHCYCENFMLFNKKEIFIESQDFTFEEIQNAYNFFPQDSLIGSFCKQNPTDNNCIIIAKHYICFNDVHHIIEKKEENLSQQKILKQKKEIIYEQIAAAEMQCSKLPLEEQLALLDPETREIYNTKNQLSPKEKSTLRNVALEKKFGITGLQNQLDTISKQLDQLIAENIEHIENKARKKIYGYYSALDFDVCKGKSSYHKAVKNLLAMMPDDALKYKEAEKINEGLHNAYHDKKQS